MQFIYLTLKKTKKKQKNKKAQVVHVVVHKGPKDIKRNETNT